MKNKSLVERSPMERVAPYDVGAEIDEALSEMNWPPAKSEFPDSFINENKQKEVSRFRKALGDYAVFVPEFDEPRYEVNGKEIVYGRTRRADAELRNLTRDKNGVRLSEKEILDNVYAITLRMQTKVKQLHNNRTWLSQLEVHEISEDIRLEREFELMKSKGEPGDLRRLMRRRFVASTPEAFESAPRTKQKMVEEMLVSPAERLIYSNDTDEVRNVDLEGIVVDPIKVNDTLLRNLGLEKFVMPKKVDFEVHLQARKNAIPKIKTALTDLTPLALDLRGPTKDRYMRTFATEDGYILGTTYTSKGKQLFRSDLVDAANRIEHIHAGYKAEIPKLINIQNVIRGIDKKVDEKWSKVNTPEELAKIKSEFTELVNGLWLVNNKFKVQIRELLLECLTMDSTFKRKTKGADGKMREEIVTRPNPAAKRAKWNTVPTKIAQRINEISRIERHLAEDEIRIMTYKAEHESIPFEAMYKYIEERAEENKKRIGEVKPRVLDKDECLELKNKLADWKSRFVPVVGEKVFLEPYRSFANKTVVAIEKAEVHLNEDVVSRQKMASDVLEVFLVLKLQTFWSEIQKTYEKHLSGKELPYFIELRNELADLFRQLRDKKVAGKTKTPRFDDVYHELYKLLGQLINLAQDGRIATRDKDKQAAWKIKGKMHKLVAETDIVKLIKGLEM